MLGVPVGSRVRISSPAAILCITKQRHKYSVRCTCWQQGQHQQPSSRMHTWQLPRLCLGSSWPDPLTTPLPQPCLQSTWRSLHKTSKKTGIKRTWVLSEGSVRRFNKSLICQDWHPAFIVYQKPLIRAYVARPFDDTPAPVGCMPSSTVC